MGGKEAEGRKTRAYRLSKSQTPGPNRAGVEHDLARRFLVEEPCCTFMCARNEHFTVNGDRSPARSRRQADRERAW